MDVDGILLETNVMIRKPYGYNRKGSAGILIGIRRTSKITIKEKQEKKVFEFWRKGKIFNAMAQKEM